VKKLEARGGFKPPIKVLPTFALSLGDRAFVKRPGLHWITFVPEDRDSTFQQQGAIKINKFAKFDNRVKSVERPVIDYMISTITQRANGVGSAFRNS
jgi:hypothetical protein